MGCLAHLVRWPLGILQLSPSPERGRTNHDSEMSNTPPSPFLGTNIYAQLILLVASFFGGMSQDTAGLIVSAGAAVVAAFFAIRNWIVNAKFSLNKTWVSDPNNWTYIAAVVGGILPSLAELVTPLKTLSIAIVNKSLAEILTGAFAIFSFIYYRFIKKSDG